MTSVMLCDICWRKWSLPARRSCFFMTCDTSLKGPSACMKTIASFMLRDMNLKGPLCSLEDHGLFNMCDTSFQWRDALCSLEDHGLFGDVWYESEGTHLLSRRPWPLSWCVVQVWRDPSARQKTMASFMMCDTSLKGPICLDHGLYHDVWYKSEGSHLLTRRPWPLSWYVIRLCRDPSARLKTTASLWPLEDHGLFHDVWYEPEEVSPGRLDLLCPLVAHGRLNSADELRSYQLQTEEGMLERTEKSNQT